MNKKMVCYVSAHQVQQFLTKNLYYIYHHPEYYNQHFHCCENLIL